MAEQGAELVLLVVDQLEQGTASPIPQDKSQATKAPRLSKEHGLIDWSKTAQEIKNQVRALQPWPRAYTAWQRKAGEPLRLILHRVDIIESAEGDPGSVVQAEGELLIATGAGGLRIEQVQPAGKRTMTAEEFLRGNPVQIGDRFA